MVLGGQLSLNPLPTPEGAPSKLCLGGAFPPFGVIASLAGVP